MSATLSDDSPLTRELGCDMESVANPITASSDRGVGERMILPAELIDAQLDRNTI